ncbi:AMP-binding protein [Rhodococcus olei]|uniref:AMP-binding protein n=1 Tax=Rhodococcus olei TaxID=2161675 RepID=A0ABP8PR97_9NOCA
MTTVASSVLEAALAEVRQVQQANWPAAIPREVRDPIGSHGLVDHLRHWAAERPDTVAIAFYGREIGYAEYDELSDRFAGWLLANGAVAGDRIGVNLGNCPQFHIAMLGILKIGAVHVPVNPMLREHELAHELSDAGVTIVLTQPALAPFVESVRERTPVRLVATTDLSDMLTGPAAGAPFEVADPTATDWHTIMGSPRAEAIPTDPDALAALNYTGGTTGLPKGCEHTQRHMVYTAATATVATGRQVGENPPTALVFLPVFWIAGEDFGILLPLVNGGTVVLMTRWDARVALAEIERYHVTSMVGTVDNYVELMDTPGFADRDLTSLDNPMAVSFVLKLDSATRARWREATGNVLREASYGMTETHTADTITLGFQDGDHDLAGDPVFCGLPVPGTDVLIVDPDGNPVPLGEQGQIIVRSPSVMTAYHRNPAATEDALRDGWLQTGDLGKFSDRGALHYLARNKEMIKTNGMSVFPSEVESLLMLHPAIERAAVVPKPDRDRGQVAFAFVQLVEGEETVAADLVEWARGNMAAYKVPEIEILDALPMTATGKVRKGDLFAMAEGR